MRCRDRVFSRAFYVLDGRGPRPRRSSVAFDDGTLALALVIGTDPEPYCFILASGSHLTTADKHAVTINRDPARQQWRVVALLEARFEKRGRIDHRHRAHREIGRDGRSEDTQALGALAGADTDAARDLEHHLE